MAVVSRLYATRIRVVRSPFALADDQLDEVIERHCVIDDWEEALDEAEQHYFVHFECGRTLQDICEWYRGLRLDLQSQEIEADLTVPHEVPVPRGVA